MRSQRAVVAQQMSEGSVLAPKDGRVLTHFGHSRLGGRCPARPSPASPPGALFLRLSLPERHAALLQMGAPVLLAPRGQDAGVETEAAAMRKGRIVKIYPEIDNGRVIADAEVENLGDHFVGERVQILAPVGVREVMLIPRAAVTTRSGVDYVRLQRAEGPLDVAIVYAEFLRARHGRSPHRPRARRQGAGHAMRFCPMNESRRLNRQGRRPDRPLGLAGYLTRAFIASPLTPLLLIAALALGLLALVTLPREEEPQISVPMVDIVVQANGLKAEDAVKLVTEPLETIVKGINGVEHVYSKTYDDQVVVTARFLVGSSTDAAILRVHDKVRANMDKIPAGHSGAPDRRARHRRRRHRRADPVAQA